MNILGIKIDNLTKEQVLNNVGRFMLDDEQHYIVTPNPEFIVKAQKDIDFKQILNQADLAIADGIGLIFASWFSGGDLKHKITGIDLMEDICKQAEQKNWLVSLFGGELGVAEKTVDNLKRRYANLKVGVFQDNIKIQPAILFVALGAPKQEKWIVENLPKMPQVKLAIGVGGAFDFISGRIKRAPKILRILGLEWAWRLILQPKRFGRIFNAVIVFPLLVIKERLYDFK
ncbi:WecB/TagA/CpsF family glycosyltransferase [Patescibacteria group bacterium]